MNLIALGRRPFPLFLAVLLPVACDRSDGPMALGPKLGFQIVTPDASFAYVANTGANFVTVVSTATNTMTAKVTVGSIPTGVAITPSGAFAYVTNRGSDNVSVIETAGHTVVATVPVGDMPSGIAISAGGGRAYIANLGSDNVSVIATGTNTVTATVPVGDQPFGIAVSPNGSYVYVTNRGSGSVSIIQTATNSVTTVGVGSDPFDVAFTPNGAFAYVTNQGSGTVSVIATSTSSVVATVGVGAPKGVAITPDGAFALVTQGLNQLAVIATASNTRASEIFVEGGGTPLGIAITPDGVAAYVTRNAANDVAAITLPASSTFFGTSSLFAGTSTYVPGPRHLTTTFIGGGVSSTFAAPADAALVVPNADPGFTPPGSDVDVTPIDQTTDALGPVQITFASVSSAGTTTVTSSTVGSGDCPNPPASFKFGSPPTCYDIETTATVTPPITVCVTWVEGTYNNESALKLVHRPGTAWEDITLPGYPDTQNNIICGSASSLSPFIAAEQEQQDAPVVTSLTLPAAPIALGTPASITASFTDANTSDHHTATIGWDDGTTSGGTVTEQNGAGTVTGTHTHAAPGVYTVTVTVSDGGLTGSRSSDLSTPAFIVVYDPTAGFVTGGGWINSPTGAYAPNPALTGKGSFGFVAKYPKGKTVPTGNTEFQFQAAGFQFQSTTYEWLVVAGARGQFKGDGTINGGSTAYAFLLTAVDGQVSGGGGVDRFRIKVWDKQTGDVIYDNQRGADDSATPTTALGGGSIVIHK